MNERDTVDDVGATRQIDRHRTRWQEKPSLRLVYEDYLNRIREALVPGSVLEIGGGSGNLKDAIPNCTSLDVQWAPWLDLVADAHRLPFRENSYGNVVMLDVLHHLSFPVRFLREAARVLVPGGRLIMIEPNISPVSWLFFKLLHEEPVLLSEDPFDSSPRSGPSPYQSNQAIPYLMFVRKAERLREVVSELHLHSVSRFSLWAYPLSGGFQPWTLLPERLAGPLLRVERPLSRLLGPLAGFRLMAVAEKRAAPV
jgi:SAM-dependent methyltransferase